MTGENCILDSESRTFLAFSTVAAQKVFLFQLSVFRMRQHFKDCHYHDEITCAQSLS